jgi:putative ABC transport system permease protein
MQTIWQDLRYGARMLLKNPAFTLIAVLTLALGVGANTAIFSVVNSLLLRPLPYPDSNRLVTLSGNGEEGPTGNTGYATFLDWRERSQSFDPMVIIRSWGGTVTGQGEPERIEGLRVSQGYFRMLGATPALGRDFKVEEDRPDTRFVVMLSHSFWQRRFKSDPGVIGKPITLSGQTFTVAGVMPSGFEDYLAANFYKPADVWAPLGYDVAQPFACRTCQHLKVVGRLKPGVTLNQATAEMTSIHEGLRRENPKTYGYPGVTIKRLQEHFIGSIRQTLYLLLVAVAFVLLIACANVANLLLARAAHRATEIAIRLAVGANRWRILRQLLIESLLLSLLGAGCGLLLAMWGTELLVKLSPATMLKLQDVKTDISVLAFTLLVSLLTGILFGIVPALQASQSDVQLVLKEGGDRTQSGRQNRLRSLLVISEIALALVLLVGAGLLIRSFIRILNVTPGFEQRNLLTMMVPATGAKYQQDGQVIAFYQNALERVKRLPGVVSAGIVSNLPFGGNGDRFGFHIEEKPLANPSEAPSAERYGISPDYLQAMGIPVLRGRGFTDQDTANAPLVVLISETSARRFWAYRNGKGEDPIGKRVRLGAPTSPLRTVVGIVGDVDHQGLDDQPDTQVYTPQAQVTDSYMLLVVRTSVDPVSLTAAVRKEIHSIDSDIPVYQISTMKQLISQSMAQRRFTLVLLGVFAAIALLMAAIGIYGVFSYWVTQRSQEIGIRVALGAQTRDVLKLVIGHGMTLAISGVGIGLVASFALTRLMENMLFGIGANDALTLVSISLLLILAALLACWIPARRATKVDPIVALRCE